MDRPHVLILTVTALTIDLPAHQAVDIDKRVTVDHDPAQRLAQRVECPAFGIVGLNLDAGDPAVVPVSLNPALALRQGQRPAIAVEKAIRDRIPVGLHVGDGEKSRARAVATPVT